MSTAPTHAGISGSFRALRHRNFRLFWSGQLVSLVGTWMQSVAQGWLMHRLTASAFMLGVLGFAQLIAAVPLALPAGVVADRMDKRKLLMVTQSSLLLQATLLALVVSTGVVTPWMVVALALVYGCAATFDLPARQSFVIELTGREDLPNGIALNSAAFNAARVLGPSAAGLLIITIGEAGCFWLNALSFVAVLLALSAMRLPPRQPTGIARSLRSTLSEGVHYAWATPSLRNLLLLLAACAGIGFQYNVLLPVYARDVLHAGPKAYGAMLAAFGVGSLLAAARMTRPLDRWALRYHLLVGLALASVGTTVFALVHRLPVMLAAGALAGFGLVLYVSSTNILIQMTTEDHFRGRIMSLYTLMFVGTSPFGALIAGAIAQRYGAPASTCASAVVLLGGAVWVAVRLRVIAAREGAAIVGSEAEPMG
jgi:MFS family permease